MNYHQAGASQIYLNGRLLYHFNANENSFQKKESSHYREYTTFSFDDQPRSGAFPIPPKTFGAFRIGLLSGTARM